MTADERHEAEVKGGARVDESIGPSAFAGIQPGDVILRVDNVPVSKPARFRQKIERSGNAVALQVPRNGQRMFVAIDIDQTLPVPASRRAQTSHQFAYGRVVSDHLHACITPSPER